MIGNEMDNYERRDKLLEDFLKLFPEFNKEVVADALQKLVHDSFETGYSEGYPDGYAVAFDDWSTA